MEKLKNEMLLNFEAGATIGEIREMLNELSAAGLITSTQADRIVIDIVKIGVDEILNKAV